MSLVTEQDLRAKLDSEPDIVPLPDFDLESPDFEPEPDSEAEPESGWEVGVRGREQGCHRMLLRLAGRLPDGLLTRSRDWLAAGELGDLARSVAFWAVSQDAVLTEDDAALLSGLLTEANADPSGLAQLTLEDFDPFPYYAFASEIPPELDNDGEADSGAGAPVDASADQVAVQALAAEPGAIGLWRAWRFPADGAPWPPPKRVFVVEVAGVDAAGVAARLQDRLATAGETDPQVEVYETGLKIPVYQEFAQTYGELLWAAAPDSGTWLATIFDEMDAETGPYFRSDHPLLADDEVDKVMQYLLGGEPLLVTDGLMDDILDSTQLLCVPMSFRTDGTWVWNEASAYYAEQYWLEPDARLLAQMRSNGYVPPAVDGVARHRALKILQDSAGEEVAWMFDPEFGETESEPGQDLDAELEDDLDPESDG